MARKSKTRLNMTLWDEEVSSVIRYLDPDPEPESSEQTNNLVLGICISFVILLLGCMVLSLFSRLIP